MKWLPYVLLTGLLSVPLLFHMKKEAAKHRLIKQTLSFDKLPEAFDGCKVFFVSDLHKRLISKSLLDEVGTCDLVIIGGDLLESGVSTPQIKQNLQRISACGPTYFVWGNNDVEVDEEILRDLLNKTGVQVLENSGAIISRHTDALFIAGGTEPLEVEQYHHLSKQASDYPFSIFVCHFPQAFKQLPVKHPFSFMLGGHTHGGQIRLLGLSVARHGSIQQKQQAVELISNGYGTSKLPLRLGALPEAHLFTLRAGLPSIQPQVIYQFED